MNGIFIPWLMQNLSGSAAASGATVTQPLLVKSFENFTTEIRIRFPSANDSVMTPTELSGAIVTISSGTLASSYCSLWYEKSAATLATGNIYLTSSAGRLQLTSASIFDGNFYNLAIVKDTITGSMTLYATRYRDDDLVYSTSSISLSGTAGYPYNSDYSLVELGSSSLFGTRGQFWAQEFRQWTASLDREEILAHANHFESYGRNYSWGNRDLELHWRMDDGASTDSNGNVYVVDSTFNMNPGTGSNFPASSLPFTKFLLDYSYIPSIDYGWNQQKIRTYTGSWIAPQDRYEDEKFVSLEFNMYDALNENISHIMTSYEELGDFLGRPMARYRADYEGLQQMRETYFKRLQGPLSFNTFVKMLDFFDTSFIGMIERLLPARATFKGDELVVESHMLERSKFQYELKPVQEGIISISGSISIGDRYEDDHWG